MMESSLRIYFAAEITLVFLSALLSFMIAIVPDKTFIIMDLELVVYLAIIYLNFRRKKAFNLYQIWLVAYVFIIWAEMCIIANKEAFSYSYIIPFIRFSVANACVLLGYLFFRNEKNYSYHKSQIKSNSWFAAILVMLSFYFIYKRLPTAMNNFNYGRSLVSAKGGGSVAKSLSSALGMILPALIAYYCRYVKKRNILFCFIMAFPIIVLQVFLSTRYKFFFSILPFLIITGIFNIKKNGKKHLLLLVSCMIVMMAVSTYVKENRNIGFANVEEDYFSKENEDISTTRLTVKIAKQMSPEGVIRMARIADAYFSTHALHYGRESAFILYFWVPRSLWDDKPTMLDYWLIREHDPFVADTYSSASGFIGELRADFGWGCLLFALLIGCLLNKLDSFCSAVFSRQTHSLDMVLASIIYPWVFFFVRSPQTSTMAFLWEILIYLILRHLFTKKEM